MAEKTVPAPVEESRGAASRETTRAEDRYIAPPVDIFEGKDGLTVVADLPGVDQGALDIQVNQGVLTIQAKTEHTTSGTPIHREFQLVNFFRQFQLPERVNVEEIGASLQNGVLTLKLPWAPEVKPRKIQVKAE